MAMLGQMAQSPAMQQMMGQLVGGEQAPAGSGQHDGRKACSQQVLQPMRHGMGNASGWPTSLTLALRPGVKLRWDCSVRTRLDSASL